MTAALEGGEWSAAHPGRTLPPGNTRYPFYRRLGGPQGRSGRAENLVPTRIRSRTVQPVVAIPTELPGPHKFMQSGITCRRVWGTYLNLYQSARHLVVDFVYVNFLRTTEPTAAISHAAERLLAYNPGWSKLAGQTLQLMKEHDHLKRIIFNNFWSLLWA